jgi:hypothetical protein
MNKILIISYLILVFLSCNKDKEDTYILSISETSITKLNQGIETMSFFQINEFNKYYNEMISVLDNPKYMHFSHIGLYKKTKEYEEFENYCQGQSKKIYLLLIKKVIEQYNYLACEALLDFSEKEFGYSLEFSKTNGITETDVKNAYVKLIERLLQEAALFD